MSTAISASDLNELFELEERLIVSAKRFGLTMRESCSRVMTSLRFLPAAKALTVSKSISNLLQNFDTAWDEDIDPWDDREFFLLSMRSMGLTFPKDFLDRIGEGDLIEGYDMNRVQTFRNMRFMEVSGYSLLEVLSAEWTHLYDRPSAITDQMIGYCDELLWSANRTIPFTVPEHFIREIRSDDKRVFEIKFKYLTPLFSGPNQPYGMLGSSSIQLIHGEKSGDNVAFM